MNDRGNLFLIISFSDGVFSQDIIEFNLNPVTVYIKFRILKYESISSYDFEITLQLKLLHGMLT